MEGQTRDRQARRPADVEEVKFSRADEPQANVERAGQYMGSIPVPGTIINAPLSVELLFIFLKFNLTWSFVDVQIDELRHARVSIQENRGVYELNRTGIYTKAWNVVIE